MGGDRAVHAEEPAWRSPGRRSADDLRHRPRDQERQPLAGLPGRVWTAHDRLQSLQQVVAPGLLASHADGSRRSGLDRRDRRSRFDLRQGAPLRAWRERGAKAQAIGVSRGGRTTKLHVITDVLGRPAVIHLTPGNASDVRAAPEVIAAAPGPLRRLVADRGYDADALRRDLRSAGTAPVIPGRRTRKRPIRHDRSRYNDRWRVEAAFCRLKDFRRVATRYDKLAANFASAVALAAVLAFWC
jgi:transposase